MIAAVCLHEALRAQLFARPFSKAHAETRLSVEAQVTSKVLTGVMVLMETQVTVPEGTAGVPNL